MKKILIVFGTRPEAIKMAPLVHQFQQAADEFETRVCVTAQHREFLDQTLKSFSLGADYDLDIMRSGQDLYDITSAVLIGMKGVFSNYRPDVVLVHGDTTTSFVVALAAFYEKIPVAHVEAGLRTDDIYSPFPEELNRQLTARMARFHFSPTEGNLQNLLKEKIAEDKIILTGNTGIDSLFYMCDRIDKNAALREELVALIKEAGYLKFKTIDKRRPYILVTGHRRENFGQGFIDICQALREISVKHPELDIVYPVHLNPNVIGPVTEMLGDTGNIFLLDPIPYEPFILLMKNSYLLLTDSGGIQEEAPALNIPTLVMRNKTERTEAVNAGTVRLTGTDPQIIVSEVEYLLENKDAYDAMAAAKNPYGDGKASQRIVDFFRSFEF